MILTAERKEEIQKEIKKDKHIFKLQEKTKTEQQQKDRKKKTKKRERCTITK